MMWDDYNEHMNDGWSVGGWLMLIVMVLFLVMLAVTLWLLLRSSMRADGGSERPAERRASAAEEVLAERFARGELDEEEYRRRRDVLRL